MFPHKLCQARTLENFLPGKVSVLEREKLLNCKISSVAFLHVRESWKRLRSAGLSPKRVRMSWRYTGESVMINSNTLLSVHPATSLASVSIQSSIRYNKCMQRKAFLDPTPTANTYTHTQN